MSDIAVQNDNTNQVLPKAIVRWRELDKGTSDEFPVVLGGSVQRNIYYEIWKDVAKNKFLVVEWLFNDCNYYDQDNELCDTLEIATKLVEEVYAAEAVKKLSVLNNGEPTDADIDYNTQAEIATKEALDRFNNADKEVDVWDIDTNEDPT